jgi:hypothetical protein
MRAFAGTDRFVIVRQLGEGGMGVEHEAHLLRLSGHERDCLRVFQKSLLVKACSASALVPFGRPPR